MEGVPQDVVGAAGGHGRCVDHVFGPGVDVLELLAGGASWGGDGRIRVAERGRAGAGLGARAQGRRVDKNEELGLVEVCVGQVGEDSL